MKVIYNQDKKILLKKAAKKLESLLETYRDVPILFLSSGGSALELLDKVDASTLGPHVTISVLDERFDRDFSRLPDISNSRALQKTRFFKNALKRGASFIETVPQKGESLEESADRFEKSLRDWRAQNPRGKIIITQGVGSDGHTAGIAPTKEEALYNSLYNKLYNTSHWTAGYDAQGTLAYPLRVTTTLPFLRDEVDHAVVYAVGKGKQKALRRTLANEGTIEETPARVIMDPHALTGVVP